MLDQFRQFLTGLRDHHGGYCRDCLGKLYEAPARTIDGYLKEIRLVGRPGECGNCGEFRETFRPSTS